MSRDLAPLADMSIRVADDSNVFLLFRTLRMSGPMPPEEKL